MRLRLVAVVASAVGIVVACYSPTEVELAVTTDIRCDKDKFETQILVEGAEHAVGTAYGCDPAPDLSTIGSFYVSPSGSRDAHVEVTIVHTINRGATGDPENCLRDNAVAASCVIARRAFTFHPHKTGYVNVRLYAQCIGVTDCKPGETCEPTPDGGHRCTSSETEVRDNECLDCASDAEAPFVDASRDATSEGIVTGTDSGKPPAACVALDGGNVRGLLGAEAPAAQIHLDTTTSKLVWALGSGDVASMPTDGSSAPAVFHARSVPGTEARAVATNAGHAFIIDSARLFDHDLATGKPVGLPVTLQVQPRTLAVNTAAVFVGSPNGIERVPHSSGGLSSSTKVFVASPVAMSANEALFFYATSAEIDVLYPDGGATGVAPFPMLDVASALVAEPTDDKTYYLTPHLVGLSKNSFTSAAASATYLAVAPGNVPYWIDHGTDNTDSIVTRQGNTVATIMSGLSTATGIAADTTCVYFVATNVGPTAGLLPYALRARGR